jgi:hypothetical protein
VEDGGFQVLLDGTELVPGGAVQTTFDANKPLTIEITGAEFKGHFFRLGRGASGVESPEAFSDPVSGQIASPCVSEGISGFTHTDNAVKTSASATLTFPNEADTSIPLDVTIVVANCGTSSEGNVEVCDPRDSTYYYSQYILRMVARSRQSRLLLLRRTPLLLQLHRLLLQPIMEHQLLPPLPRLRQQRQHTTLMFPQFG